MGANKPIEDIEATLLAATKSALWVRLRKISVLPLTVSNRCKKSSESGEMLFWIGSSKRDLLAMPDSVVRQMGAALNVAQNFMSWQWVHVLSQ